MIPWQFLAICRCVCEKNLNKHILVVAITSCAYTINEKIIILKWLKWYNLLNSIENDRFSLFIAH